MKKTIFITCCLTLCCFFATKALANDIYLIYNPAGAVYSAETLKALLVNPKIKFSFVLNSSQTRTPDLLIKLSEQKIAEPIVAFNPEPALAQICEVKKSSSSENIFSCVEDAAEITAKVQENIYKTFGKSAKSAYLQDISLNEKLADCFLAFGIKTVVSPNGPKTLKRIDNVLLIGANVIDSKYSSKDLFDALNSQSVFVVVNTTSSKETAELIKDIASTFSGWEFKTLSEFNDIALNDVERYENMESSNTASDATLWQKLYVTRKALEDYKNSGFAKLPVLEVAKQQMFSLYNYKLLSAAGAGNTDAKLEFNDKLLSVWKALDVTPPADLTATQSAGSYFFEVDQSSQILKIDNAVFSSTALLNGFEVKVTSDVVDFFVDISTDSQIFAGSADIYIDLNGLSGAGSTALLAPISGAAFPTQSGWEYALRINDRKAKLYTFSEYSEQIISEFAVTGSFNVSIPVGLLRGTPLSWGYQVVLFENFGPTVKIIDYISQDAAARANAIKTTPIILQSFRAENHQ
ncbi:MAG: hypothetical protein M0Q46_01930 [Endomicrobiales bacterium]|nr:hypothetical protein [Endomicrobiales bacterium]